jgi:VIT1/CCC1 family predicted Fe2+/Mn2+ transporter
VTADRPAALDPDHHPDVSGGWLRAATFGAMDGLVTNIALIAGVGGGGVSPGTIVLAGVARQVAEVLKNNPEEALRVHAQEEMGVDPDNRPNPWTAAISSFVCFSIGGLVPLLPYLLGSTSLRLALSVGGLGLFGAGVLIARFTRRPWWVSGLRVLLLGATAAAATYGIGALIGVGGPL